MLVIAARLRRLQRPEARRTGERRKEPCASKQGDVRSCLPSNYRYADTANSRIQRLMHIFLVSRVDTRRRAVLCPFLCDYRCFALEPDYPTTPSSYVPQGAFIVPLIMNTALIIAAWHCLAAQHRVMKWKIYQGYLFRYAFLAFFRAEWCITASEKATRFYVYSLTHIMVGLSFLRSASLIA